MLRNTSPLVLSFEDYRFYITPEQQLYATKTIFLTALAGLIKDIILPTNLSYSKSLASEKVK